MSNKENDKIRISLINVFTKISSSHTVSVGQEMLKKIIQESETSENKLNYILSQISEQINSLKKSEKKDSIKLLSTVCIAIKNISPYLSRILTILQSNIMDDNASIFTTIASTYGEIVENSIKAVESQGTKDSDSDIPNKQLKTVYELLQGFCIYNMKQEAKANQICGSLCLTSLIETCPIILQPAYMKYIWENIIYFIDKPNYNAKSELLNSLISLIFASEGIFKPFSTVTLYKILDFLTDNDWFRRKLALNVIYTLIIYCQDEILPLKGHIVEFLRVLKSDKVKEVREVCMQTLKLFNEAVSESETEEVKEKDSNIKEINPSSNTNNNKAGGKSENKKEIKSIKELSPIRPEKSTAPIPSTLVAKKSTPNIPNQNKKTIPRSSTNNNFKVNKTIDQEDTLNISGPIRSSASNTNITSSSRNKKIEPTPSNNNKNERMKTPTKRRAVTPTRKRMNNSSNLDLSHDNVNITTENNNNTSRREREKELKVNRKDDNSFVNSKMVIKRDPSYSIFKTEANQEFFSNAPKETGEIQVVFKEKSAKEEAGKGSIDNKDDDVVDEEENYVVNYVKMNNKQKSTNNKSNEMPLQMSVESFKGNTSDTFNKEKKKRENNLINTNENDNILKTSNSNYLANSQGDYNKYESFADNRNINNISINLKEENNKLKGEVAVDSNTNNNFGNNSNVDVSDLIRQMKMLSDKQVFLIDTIEKIQENSRDQFTNMNNRIQSLEKTVQNLVGVIKTLQAGNTNNNQYQYNYSTNTSTSKYESNTYPNNTDINKEDFDSFGNMKTSLSSNLGNQNYNNKRNTTLNTNSNNSNCWGEILQELKNKNPSSAFTIAINSSDEINIIKLIDKISVTQIKEVDQSTMEESISRLTGLITRGQYIMVIISFFKTLLVTLEYTLRKQIHQNIKDILLYISSNKIQFNLGNEEMIDINLLLSVINSKLNPSNKNNNNANQGISNLISAFASNTNNNN